MDLPASTASLWIQRFRTAAPKLGFPDDLVSDDTKMTGLFEFFEDVSTMTVFDTLTKLAAVTNQVCEIRTKNPDLRLGTGFLVGPDLILTASHVVRDDEVLLPNVECRFNNIVFGSGEIKTDSPTVVGITKQEASSLLDEGQPVTLNALDVTLLRLDTAVGDATRKFIKITGESTVGANKSVYVVEFPAASSVSFAGGTVPKAFNSVTEAAFQHNAQTSQGASGSPVFNNAFDLVGLHRGLSMTGPDNEAIDAARIFSKIKDHL
jgi:V8-like Glu-specific endopeptidase